MTETSYQAYPKVPAHQFIPAVSIKVVDYFVGLTLTSSFLNQITQIYLNCHRSDHHGIFFNIIDSQVTM